MLLGAVTTVNPRQSTDHLSKSPGQDSREDTLTDHDHDLQALGSEL